MYGQFNIPPCPSSRPKPDLADDASGAGEALAPIWTQAVVGLEGLALHPLSSTYTQHFLHLSSTFPPPFLHLSSTFSPLFIPLSSTFPPPFLHLHSIPAWLPILPLSPGLRPAGKTASQFYLFEYQDCSVWPDLDHISLFWRGTLWREGQGHFIQKHSYPISLCVWQLIEHFKSAPSPLGDHLLGAQTRHIRSTFWRPKCSALSLGWEIKDPER